MTNKEIRRLKVAIHDEDSSETASREAVQGLVRLMLGSPGEIKKLLIYGEPFLRFGRVREIALHARAEAEKAGKDLDFSICASASGIRLEQLDFLRKQRFFLSLSMDGGAGERLPRVFDELGRRRTMAVQRVRPDDIERMPDGFKALVDLGFENVEVEAVQGPGWPERKALFEPMLQRVLDWIWDEAHAGRFRFLVCSLAPLMLGEDVLLDDMCPFYSSLECRSDGEYSFHPRGPSVGGALAGVTERYRDCSFDKDSELCKGCASDYHRGGRINEDEQVHLWRVQMARGFMNKILLAARTDPVMKEYLREAMIRCRIS